jgi:hypothetical protein
MWELNAQERLQTWRRLRQSYDQLDFEQSLLETTRIWSYAPYVNHYLDYQEPQTWPDPWNLLAENYYCDLAKTLGMLYTLYLSRHGPEHSYAVKIAVQPENKEIYNLVWIDQGKYILNLDFAEVVNTSLTDAGLIELRYYTDQDLRLDRFI